MTSTIRCTSLARYDQASQSYLICGTEVEIPAGWQSSTIECPNCGNLVSLLSQPTASSTTLGTAAAKTPAAKIPAARPQATNTSATKPVGAGSALVTPQASAPTPPNSTTPVAAKSTSTTSPTHTPQQHTTQPAAKHTPQQSPLSPTHKPAPQASAPAQKPNPPIAARPAPTSSSPLEALQAIASLDDLNSPVAHSVPTDLLAIDSALPVSASVLGASPIIGKPCRFCGTRLQAGMVVCPKCGGTRKAIWSDEIPIDKMKIVPAGFQRSAGLLLGKGLSAKQLVLTVGILLGVMAVMSLLVLAVAGPLGIGIGGTFYAIVGFVFYQVVHHSNRIAHVPAAPLNSWQRMLWRTAGSLFAARGWRTRGIHAGLERLQVHEKSFSDSDLLSQADLTKINVLVLKNTQITDEGLRYLRGLHQLRYLYLEGTQVTNEGVFRLQQTIPLCWIWW